MQRWILRFWSYNSSNSYLSIQRNHEFLEYFCIFSMYFLCTSQKCCVFFCKSRGRRNLFPIWYFKNYKLNYSSVSESCFQVILFRLLWILNTIESHYLRIFKQSFMLQKILQEKNIIPQRKNAKKLELKSMNGLAKKWKKNRKWIFRITQNNPNEYVFDIIYLYSICKLESKVLQGASLPVLFERLPSLLIETFFAFVGFLLDTNGKP